MRDQRGRLFLYVTLTVVTLCVAAVYIASQRPNQPNSDVKNPNQKQPDVSKVDVPRQPETPKTENIKLDPEIKDDKKDDKKEDKRVQETKEPLDQYFKLIADGNLPEAKKELNRLYFDRSVSLELKNKIEEEMMFISHCVLCENDFPGEFEMYVVKEGDSLVDIAKRISKERGIKIEYGVIKLINGIKSEVIKPGQKLRLPVSDLSIVVRKSGFKLFIFYNGIAIRSCKIGTGKQKSTPIGEFTLGAKTASPIWYPPDGHEIKGTVSYGDPKNPLGTHWIGLVHSIHHGFGIHGTWDDNTLGEESSLGCIRLSNDNAKILYEIAAVGMKVIIMD